MARPRIPVLVGTVALLAGCGSDTRVEVSGVVRDGETGRAIANALVVGTDGSSTRTDADGRFSLFVRGDERRSIRASAHRHEDGALVFDPASAPRDESLAFSLAPLHEPARIEEDDPDAVLRWLRETWLSDADARDDETDPTPSWSRDALASLDDDAFERPEHAVTHAMGASCASCHEGDTMEIAAPHVDVAYAPHASLDGGCLACHADAPADEGRSLASALESDLDAARCVGCHAGGASDLRALRAPAIEARARAEAAFARAASGITRCGHTAASVTRIDGVLVLVDARGFALGDCDASGSIDGSEVAIGVEVLSPAMAAAAEDLARLSADRSRGVHQPALTRALAARIEVALH